MLDGDVWCTGHVARRGDAPASPGRQLNGRSSGGRGWPSPEIDGDRHSGRPPDPPVRERQHRARGGGGPGSRRGGSRAASQRAGVPGRGGAGPRRRSMKPPSARSSGTWAGILSRCGRSTSALTRRRRFCAAEPSAASPSSLREPAALEAQLRALLRAGAATALAADLRVMLPLVECAEQVEAARRVLHAAHQASRPDHPAPTCRRDDRVAACRRADRRHRGRGRLPLDWHERSGSGSARPGPPDAGCHGPLGCRSARLAGYRRR